MSLPILRYFLLLASFSLFVLPDAPAQNSSSRTSVSKTSRKPKKTNDADEPWKKIPLLLDRPERKFEVIALVNAPQIFLWDTEDAMKESLQKQAWKMKADAVILDRVDTSFRFTGPAGGANGRAIRYK
ncbi:MAG: hypothetical protein NTZ01_02620 [Verrucomicrobia bacterium]|nr:hypothetical protein [Verrucomicrobiota bacterium]